MDAPDTTLSAESTVSYLLPNLEVYRALNGAGLSDPGLSERVTVDVTTLKCSQPVDVCSDIASEARCIRNSYACEWVEKTNTCKLKK